MIKINLLAQPKKFKIPVVMGLDIRMFNFKMLFIVWIISYVPEVIQSLYFETERASIEKEINLHQAQIKKYNKILAKNRNVKRKIEAFDRQAKKLKERESQVIEIIKERTNPFKVLIKLARSLPDEVWTDGIKINEKAIDIKGFAISYKSIGELIDTLNDSIYFSKSIRLKKTESVKRMNGKEEFRIERFNIAGNISRFD